MRTLFLTTISVFFLFTSFSQVELDSNGITKANGKDTMRYKLGNMHIYVFEDEENDIIDAGADDKTSKINEAHWSGLELGVNMLLNAQQNYSFPQNKYWENDPANSFNLNLNLFNTKLPIYKHYIGVVTGFGFNFTQFAFKNNYVLNSNKDSLFGVIDTVFNYSKNKLKASYLQIPLLLEFSSKKGMDGFYFATGVIGGLRLSSKTKREGGYQGKNFEEKIKGTYSLNSFKLDATFRAGYGNCGVFATYALIPLFETEKTVQVHPITFGISWNM